MDKYRATMRSAIALAHFFALTIPAQIPAPPIDWSKTGEDGMRHFQCLVQIDSTGAPGTETKVAEYGKNVLGRTPPVSCL